MAIIVFLCVITPCSEEPANTTKSAPVSSISKANSGVLIRNYKMSADFFQLRPMYWSHVYLSIHAFISPSKLGNSRHCFRVCNCSETLAWNVFTTTECTNIAIASRTHVHMYNYDDIIVLQVAKQPHVCESLEVMYALTTRLSTRLSMSEIVYIIWSLN